MKNKHDTARSALMIIVCILIIGSTSVLFISQMNGMVQNNIMNTISELAEHDLVSIQNFVRQSGMIYIISINVWRSMTAIQFLRFRNG